MHIRVLLVLAGLTWFGSFLFTHTASANAPSIVISEIGAYEASGYEWIEIYNASDEAVSLTDWIFYENQTNHGISAPSGTDVIVESHTYAVIAQNDALFREQYPDVTVSIYDSAWGSLNESGEELSLKDAEGDIVESFTYPPAPDRSLERVDLYTNGNDPNNWQEHPILNSVGQENYWSGIETPMEDLPPTAVIHAPTEATVGQPIEATASSSTDDFGIAQYTWNFDDLTLIDGESVTHTYASSGTYLISLRVIDTGGNVATSSQPIIILDPIEETPTTTDYFLVLNEFLVDPIDGNEWIELYNPLDEPILLDGWLLADGVGTIAAPTGTIVANGYTVIELPANKLNNGGDELTLVNPHGATMAAVSYGDWESAMLMSPAKGNTIARTLNGTYVETISSTKGHENLITSPLSNEPDNAPPPSNGGGQPQTNYKEGAVVINELVSDPADGEEEFVELFNADNATISLSGWWIEDGSEAKTMLSGNLPASGHTVIEKPKGNLNNTGDYVALYSPSGEIIDSVTYGSWDDGNLNDNAETPTDPQSLARKKDGLDANNDIHDFRVTMTVTPGSENIITELLGGELIVDPSVESHAVRINEVLPNPAGSDAEDEFIELMNTGEETIDITGWSLGDGSNKRYTIADGVMNKDEMLVFYRKQTGIALNNTGGDSVTVYSPSGAIADAIEYSGRAGEDESFAMREDGSFAWTTKPSPGGENEIHGPSSAPIILIDVQTEAVVGETLLFDASDTTDPNGGDLTFTWDFGDGETAKEDVVTHAFSSLGIHTVTLEVTNGSGSSSMQVGIDISDPTQTDEDALSQLVINEVFPNPAGADATEFIELYNPTSSTIDMSGLKIDDGAGGSRPYTIPPATLIESHDFILFEKSETGLALNNTTDAGRLLSNDGSVIAAVRYADVIEGASYVLHSDGAWSWSSTPTPGEKNILNQIVTSNRKKPKKSPRPIIETTLASIRNEDIGDRVAVTGTVAVLPGVLGTQYFYIVGSPGIQVYSFKKDFPKLAVGDRVRITGELSETNGEMRLKTTSRQDIEIISSGKLPKSTLVSIADVGKPLEGSLVHIEGEVTERKRSHLWVDDGTEEVKVYLKKGTGIDTKILNPGDIVRVTGLISQSRSGYQLLPRNQKDIKKTGVTDEVIVAVAQEEEATQKEVAEKYLTATAGGLTSILIGLGAKSKGQKAGSIAARILSLIIRRKK